jgi:hypothetical protein
VSGIYASLAAVPLQPGWTVNETYYHWQGQAGADVSAAREITIGRFNPSVTLNLSGNLNALADIVFGTAIYTFEQPVLGGQASVGLLAAYGRTDATVNATITGTVAGFPFGPFTRQDFGEAVGFGDLYPRATLRWNQGVNNYMLYVTGDIPVGLYNSSDLANIGIGHGAIDAGGAYTYFNPETGHEFSVTGGLTYNFINPSTVPERHRRPHRLGRAAVPHQTVPDRRGRLHLPADHLRQRIGRQGRLLRVAGARHRPASRLHLPDRHAFRDQAGLPEPPGLRRVRPSEPGAGL